MSISHVQYFFIFSHLCPLELLSVTCRSSPVPSLPVSLFPLPSVHLLLHLPAELEKDWGQAICRVARERERESGTLKNCCLSPHQVDDAMLMFDKTTNRHRGETDWPGLCLLILHISASLLLRFLNLLVLQSFLGIYWSPSSPPRASFLCAELEETNRASLISQSVNRDQDKASLSTSSPPWAWSIMTAYQLCLGLLARKGSEERMSAE